MDTLKRGSKVSVTRMPIYASSAGNARYKQSVKVVESVKNNGVELVTFKGSKQTVYFGSTLLRRPILYRVIRNERGEIIVFSSRKMRYSCDSID